MSEPKQLTVPSVHLNGTSREELKKGYQAAYEAIGAARDTVGESSPNARDYYVQGNDAYSKARDEHWDRMQRLLDIRQELLALFEAVDQ